MKIISVVGARPNFMKIAPFIKAIENYNNNTGLTTTSRGAGKNTGMKENIDHILVHTGQHYDDRMSLSFFEELLIPQPDINLGVGSGTHAEQVGQTMIEFEKVLKAEKPDWVVIVGDVNAILACSVTAKKEQVRCCHIEAGLRSGDMTMPEEINRLVADRLSDLLLTPDMLSSDNLKREGVPEKKIRFVGNIMIDTLEANREKAERLVIRDIIDRNRITVEEGSKILPRRGDEELRVPDDFIVMTLHRPSNVDTKEILEPIVQFITEEVSPRMMVIWSLHPRTGKMLKTFGLYDDLFSCRNIIMLEPVSYLEMLRLNMGARIMLTDSGGLQEECTLLGTPCLTLRWNTERPVTLREHGGASVLTGNDINMVRKEYQSALERPGKAVRPELWDGKTAERCLREILRYDGVKRV